jgi:hypothetical protein
MSSDDVYALISDILGLAGRYSVENFRATRAHVEKSFQGHDRRALLRIIETLEVLVDERARANGTVRRSAPPSDTLELQEVAAILQDPAFMPRKADLLALLNKVMGKSTLKASPKDSREAVVRKAMHAFFQLPPSTRTRVYKMLHARFIKARGSSLKDWSDIISE